MIALLLRPAAGTPRSARCASRRAQVQSAHRVRRWLFQPSPGEAWKMPPWQGWLPSEATWFVAAISTFRRFRLQCPLNSRAWQKLDRRDRVQCQRCYGFNLDENQFRHIRASFDEQKLRLYGSGRKCQYG